VCSHVRGARPSPSSGCMCSAIPSLLHPPYFGLERVGRPPPSPSRLRLPEAGEGAAMPPGVALPEAGDGAATPPGVPLAEGGCGDCSIEPSSLSVP